MLHKIIELQVEEARFELDLLPSVLMYIAWMLTLTDYLYCFMIQKLYIYFPGLEFNINTRNI